MTRLTSIGREITSDNDSTSLQSTSWWMSQGRGTSYVHTGETAVNIKSLSSTNLMATPPLHVPSIGNVLVILRGPTGQYIYDKVNHPGIVSSHVFDQTAISGPLNSHAHSLISLCAHDTIWSKAHRHIQMYFPHVMNIIKWQEEATSATSRTVGKTSSTSSTTLTTNIMHSKGATITIKYNDDNTMDID